MALSVEGARLMLHRAAWLGENQPQEAALAMTASKCVANESAASVANKALQVIGGRGYVKGHPIERLVRDARAGSLMAFTTEQARDMIGKALVGMDPH
jgi:acyl-CoA dehydrogenase